MNLDTYHNFFGNFSNSTRLGIILSLRSGPLSVSDIVEKTGEEQSKVSHNLSRLVKCGILDVERDGKRRIYSINEEVLPVLELAELHIKKCRKRCTNEKCLFRQCINYKG